jgi:hypothetical protein
MIPPSFDGTNACAGQWETFDAAASGDEDAQADALEICARYVCLHQCRDWLESLPTDQRPTVCAGQLILPAPRRRKSATMTPAMTARRAKIQSRKAG